LHALAVKSEGAGGLQSKRTALPTRDTSRGCLWTGTRRRRLRLRRSREEGRRRRSVPKLTTVVWLL
jgi:hypothetical protein